MILKADVLGTGSTHPLPQGIITLRDYSFRRLKNMVVLFVKITIENIFNKIEVVFLSGCFIQDITVPPFMPVLANKKHFIVKLSTSFYTNYMVTIIGTVNMVNIRRI